MSKFENNVVINLKGNAIELVGEENFTIRNCIFYGGTPSFLKDPLGWVAIKILLWKYRHMRGLVGAAIHISEQKVKKE